MLVHKTKVQVRFGDTDPYGIVYFVAYFRYFHQGIEEFLRHIGINPGSFFRNKEEKFGMPKVAADCQFLAPAYYGDLLEMHTSIKEIREKAVIFQFHFYRPPKTRLLAEGSVTFVAIDHTWKAIPLPKIIAEKVEGL
ncbi:MAG: acyl-CoA thioesterase [Deltaproteobacteria bacterium]|jgi:acyl-CoA thioester hydrolase|nr:acyl-CoA thioesterase [Deltaproteobacteria bacterium]MBW2670775.1 acyl-CoA thioesterase [Deltaproteobacteria bacterium]MBW2710950.1 acyl-CoA thioesterase [Deltaproteobacteria bacterium]